MAGNASATCWSRIPKQRKKRRILQQIRALPAETALLAEDETDLLLFPPLRAGWARRGRAAPVRLAGYNARVCIFGALQLRTGRLLCLEQTRKRAEEFQAFLDVLREHYRSQPVALLLDENSSHTDAWSRSLAEDLDIQLLWLPKRSPHLNPLDQLWGHGKSAVCANHQPTSMGEQVTRFLGYYDDLTPQARLRQAGLLSPNYWLYQV